jgi:hypothetical protein
MMSLPGAGTNGRAWNELYGLGAVIASGLSRPQSELLNDLFAGVIDPEHGRIELL